MFYFSLHFPLTALLESNDLSGLLKQSTLYASIMLAQHSSLLLCQNNYKDMTHGAFDSNDMIVQ